MPSRSLKPNRTVNQSQNLRSQIATQYRFYLLSLVLILFAFIIGFRLYYWQVVKSDWLIASANSQHQTRFLLTPPRGRILYSNYSPMVDNRPSYNVFVNKPQLETDALQVAQAVAEATVTIPVPTPTLPPPLPDEDPEEATSSAELSPTPTLTPTPTVSRQQRVLEHTQQLVTRIQQPNLTWVPVSQQITQTTKETLESQISQGLVYQDSASRFYPEASSSAYLSGFVGTNDAGEAKGYFGLEGYYDLSLSGRSGESSQELDAFGNPILHGHSVEIPSVPGRDLITHIDESLQHYVENQLEESIYKYLAQSGTVTIMDPRTGAVLAMAAYPKYHPQTYTNFNSTQYINPIIGESYEPGSTFKVLVMAAGLDAGVITPETTCPCYGPLRIGQYTISTWDSTYRPNSTMTQVLVNSDNVGMVHISEKLGPDNLLRYLKDFGMGQKTGIDLQEETDAPLRAENSWKEVDYATASFGQGIAITRLQMLSGAAAIANKGWLMQPQVVDKIMDSNREIDIKPVPIRQVITPETAAKVTQMMVQSAAFGEAKWTALKGYNIAGKTGTAQIPDPELGGYKEEKTLASFVGFAPADDPKFVMLVTLNEPQTSPWGSETAAPLWYDIARWLFLYWNIQPVTPSPEPGS